MIVNFRVDLVLVGDKKPKIRRVDRACQLPRPCKGCVFEKVCDEIMDKIVKVKEKMEVKQNERQK